MLYGSSMCAGLWTDKFLLDDQAGLKCSDRSLGLVSCFPLQPLASHTLFLPPHPPFKHTDCPLAMLPLPINAPEMSSNRPLCRCLAGRYFLIHQILHRADSHFPNKGITSFASTLFLLFSVQERFSFSHTVCSHGSFWFLTGTYSVIL